MASEADSLGGSADEALGAFVEIATALAKLTAELAGWAGGSAVVELIAALVNVQVGQSAGLREIKADTSALRNSALNEGLHSLRDAERVGPDDPQWARYVDRAEERLSSARTLAQGPVEKALVEFNLAMAFLAMGDRPGLVKEVQHHLELSQMYAESAVDAYILRAKPGYIRDVSKLRVRSADSAPKSQGQVIKARGRSVYQWLTLNEQDPDKPIIKNREVDQLVQFGVLIPGMFAAPLFLAYDAPRSFFSRKAIEEFKGFLNLYNLIQFAVAQCTERLPAYLALEPYLAGYGEKVNKGTYQLRDLSIDPP